MGRKKPANDTVKESEAKFSSDSDQLKGILDGKTKQIPFPTLKKAISETLTLKADNKYRYPRKIGSGGMKEILKVRDRDTARDLAMAILSPDAQIQGACLARFVYEARITANLEHPNIVPIHDIGVDKAGQPYFTMKMIEGESLAHILINIAKNKAGYREEYNLPHLLTIFANVCHAIDFAHSKGIIHLDLKPENIQIGSYGEVLVLDWGLAKLVDEEDTEEALTPKSIKELNIETKNGLEKTIDGEIKGTPGFMAPEQAAGDNSKKNKTTDIFSLGALLYSILTLKKPIKGVELNEVIDKTIRGEIIPPSKRSPELNIPAPLAAITMKAMALKQEERYQSVKDLLKDIDKYIGNYLTSAEKPNIFNRLSRFFMRNKMVSSLGLIIALLLIAFIGTLTLYETKRLSKWGTGKDITPENQQDLRASWLPFSGQWEVKENSVYAVEGKENSYILLYEKPLYGNVAVEFEAEIPKSEDLQVSGDLSVILAASDKAPLEHGYFLQVGGIGNTSAVIQKRGGMQASVEYKIEPGKKYKIRAEKEGPNLRLYCNNKLIIASKDIFYLEGGYLGLYTFGKGKKFNNIRIFHKEVPELVPPTIEGDSFYRESRKTSKHEEKSKFLKLAKKAYTKVYESNLSAELSSQALLKRAYVNSELNHINEALHDAILLDGFGQSLDLLMLKGLLYFKSGNIKDAYRIFDKAIKEYLESKVTTVAVLMGHLANYKDKKIDPKLKQQLWTLCAENYSSSAFRCNGKNIDSLDFLRNVNFNLIDCSDNSIESLQPLAGSSITQLDCADNKINDLSPLKGMQLLSLECHNNPITDISPLRGMPLKTLSLAGCPVKDLSALKTLPHLERLTLPADIKDLSIIEHLPKLKYFNTEWDAWQTTKEEYLRKKRARNIKIKMEED